MSRIINNAFNSEGQPIITASDFDHIQLAEVENMFGIIRPDIGDGYNALNTYVLYGCEVSSSGGMTTVTRGAIYRRSNYAGISGTMEIFLVNGVSVFPDPTGSDVVIGTVVTTFNSFDPTPFASGATHNIHAIRNVTFSAGVVSGSEIFDLSAAVRLADVEVPTTAGVPLTSTYTFGRNQNIAVASLTGADTLTLSGVGARINQEVTIVAGFISIGDTLSFADLTGVGHYIVTGTASLTATAATIWIIKMKCFGRAGGATSILIEVYNPS